MELLVEGLVDKEKISSADWILGSYRVCDRERIRIPVHRFQRSVRARILESRQSGVLQTRPRNWRRLSGDISEIRRIEEWENDERPRASQNRTQRDREKYEINKEAVV